jgi:hypothetical protein
MPVDIDTLIREFSALEEFQHPWKDDWQDIADIMIPGQSDILTLRQPGTTRTRQLFDSTALWALDLFVANLSAWITNFSSQFFRHFMRGIRDNQEAAQWFKDVSEIQFANMTANEAPIPTAVNQAYRAYAGFGTGAVFIDELPMELKMQEGWRGFMAEELPIGRYVIAENAAGRVDTIYRKLDLTPHQMKQYDDWSLSREVTDALEEQGASRKWRPVQCLHVIRPRRGRDRSQTDQLNMPWESVYIDIDHRHLLHEGGFPWFPCMVFRWEKLLTANPYGFGRGHLALPESKTLQLIDHDMLQALPLAIQPPGWLLGASRETIGRVSLLPGVQNPLAANGGWIPYTSGQNLDAANFQIQERRDRILRTFYVDQLQFLPPATKAQPEPLGTTAMRARTMLRIMGPFLMRFLPEFFNPFLDVTFALNLRSGEFPPPPPVVIEEALTNNGRIDTEALGALSQAQRTDEQDAIIEGTQFVIGVATETQDPVLLRNIDMDASIGQFLRARGFPDNLVTDRRVMQEIREQAAQAQANVQATEQNMVEAQTAGAAAPMVREIREMANA